MQPLANYQKLYGFLLLASLAGFVWLGLHLRAATSLVGHKHTVCIIKQTTGVPCPSCGNTRAMVAAVQGDVAQSLAINPMGLILLLLMVVVPIWIIRDLALHQQGFYRFYGKTEQFFRQRWVAIPAILLVVANWVWNIWKGM